MYNIGIMIHPCVENLRSREITYPLRNWHSQEFNAGLCDSQTWVPPTPPAPCRKPHSVIGTHLNYRVN